MKKKLTLNQLLEKHTIEDRVSFAQIPTKEDIIKVVGDTVDVKINGKLIAIKSHLDNQDEVLKRLDAKIRPFSTTKVWLTNTGKVVLYVGGLAAAISAIVWLYQTIKR